MEECGKMERRWRSVGRWRGDGGVWEDGEEMEECGKMERWRDGEGGGSDEGKVKMFGGRW